jgi:four helix bundle protein
MNRDEFKKRTSDFAVRIMRLVESLPKSRSADTIARQLLRCGAAVGANYRAASRAESQADLIAKMAIVEEECDEPLYWMDFLVLAPSSKNTSSATC